MEFIIYIAVERAFRSDAKMLCHDGCRPYILYTHRNTERQKAFDSTSCGFIPSTQSILETFPSRERERHLCFSLIHHLEIYLSNPCYGLIREAPSFFTICLTSPMNLHTHTHSRAFYGVIEHKDIFVVLSDMYITK